MKLHHCILCAETWQFHCVQGKYYELNLSENVIAKSHENLVELDLSETNIGRIGACAAVEAISLKSRFKVMNFNENYSSEEVVTQKRDDIVVFLF